MEDSEPKALPTSNVLTDLQTRRVKLVEKRGKAQRMYYALLSATAVLFLLAPFLAWRFYSSNPESLLWVYPLIYLAMPLAGLPPTRMRLRQAENDIYELDFQIDLQEFEVSKQESRAEKILRLNDFQLRRYYDLNIRQNSWVFGLGVFCIVLGVAVIGVTLFLVISIADSFQTKLITASLGSVGAILSNFVAAIYLKMNAAATENLTSFHSRLVETQKLLLGNLLASRIEDDKLRWQTLSDLSLRLMGEAKSTRTPATAGLRKKPARAENERGGAT